MSVVKVFLILPITELLVIQMLAKIAPVFPGKSVLRAVL